MPCKPPPVDNAVHTTGGLPFMEDNCMWACKEGFYKEVVGDIPRCVACTTDPCPTGMLREECPIGRNKDAVCMCPINTFIDTDAESGTTTCTACAVTSCPEGEIITRCLGMETVDKSACSVSAGGSMQEFPHPA